MKFKAKQLTRGAVIAALYAVLTLVLAPISFGSVQFRISEALTVLPFILPEVVWGLTLGCLISNIINGNIIDAVLGTLATFLAAYTTSKIKKLWLAPLPAVIFNGIITGFAVTIITVEFTWTAYIMIGLSIALSELVIVYAGGIPLLTAVNGLSQKYSVFK